MTVTGESYIFESNELGFDTSLIQPLSHAVRIRAMIARLARHFQNRNLFHIYELVRGLLLNPARQYIRTIRTFLANGPKFSRVFVGRIVSNRKIRVSP